MKWKWIGKNVLVENEGHRHVVLSPDCEGNLQQCNKDNGLLEEFDPRSTNGKLIQRAPELRDVCKDLVDMYQMSPQTYATSRHIKLDLNYCHKAVEHANKLLGETE